MQRKRAKITASEIILKNKTLIAAKYTKQLVNKKQPTNKTLNTFPKACKESKTNMDKQLSNKIIKPKGKKNPIIGK